MGKGGLSTRTNNSGVSCGGLSMYELYKREEAAASMLGKQGKRPRRTFCKDSKKIQSSVILRSKQERFREGGKGFELI